MNDYLGNTPIRQLIPGILLACLLLLGFMVLREFLLTLAWALIIAYVVWPPYRYLRQQLKGDATLSAAVMTTIIAAVLFLTVYWLVAMLQDELKTAYQTLVSDFGQNTYRLPDFISRIPWLGSTAQEWLERLTDDRAAVIAQFADWAQQWSGEFAKFLGGIGRYIMKLGVILVTVFFVSATVTRRLGSCIKAWYGFWENIRTCIWKPPGTRPEPWFTAWCWPRWGRACWPDWAMRLPVFKRRYCWVR